MGRNAEAFLPMLFAIAIALKRSFQPEIGVCKADRNGCISRRTTL